MRNSRGLNATLVMQHNKPIKPKPQRGRPVERSMPERIPDTPENILKTVLAGPPKKDWNYLKKRKR